MNEYLAIDSDGYMFTKYLHIKSSMTGCSLEKSRWCLIADI